MNMFTSHRQYQRPSEVELTASERVDFDFIAQAERTLDPVFLGSGLDWADLVLIERYCTYMERWELVRYKHLRKTDQLPPAIREYLEFEYGPDQG